MKESVDPPVVTQVDGEQHDRLRASLEQALNAQVYRSTHTYIAKTTHYLVDQMLQTYPDHADLMESLAIPLPAMVIAHVIGVPKRAAPPSGHGSPTSMRPFPRTFAL